MVALLLTVAGPLATPRGSVLVAFSVKLALPEK